MTLPTPSRCACRKPPAWFSPGGGPLGRYQHECPNGDWAATAGPIPEPEARRQWDERFGQGVPVWPYDNLPPSYALGREEHPQR